MQHLIFLYYIVSLTLGITGITVTILLYVKYRLKIIKYYLVLLLLFTIYLLLLNIHYYQRTIVFLDSDLVRYTAMIIASVAFGFLFYLFPFIIHKFVENAFSLKKKIIFGIPAILYLSEIINILKLNNPILKIINEISGNLFYIIIIYMGIYIIRFLIKNKNDDKNKILKAILVMITIFLPLQIANDIIITWKNIHYPITIFPLLYLSCNIFTIIYAFKYLFINANVRMDFKIPENFIIKYNITNRETEIINFLSKGLANKQIAYEMKISSSTVKNHIHNIFQKTSSKSKIELLNLITSCH